MPDFMLKGISNELAAQLKELVQKTGLPLNDLILDLLNRGIQSMHAPAPAPAPGKKPQVGMLVQRDVAEVVSHLDSDEDAALKAALAALESLPEDNSPFRQRGG